MELEKIEVAINFVDYCTPAETNEDVELAGIAIEALEKQIPKKSNGRECACCGGDVSIYKAPYCMCCGQALDWSDEE